MTLPPEATPTTVTSAVHLDEAEVPPLSLNVGGAPAPISSPPPSITSSLQTRFQPDMSAELLTNSAISPSAPPQSLWDYDEEDSDNDWRSEDDVVDKYAQLAEECESRFLRQQLRAESKIKKQKLLKDNTRREFLLYDMIRKTRHGRLTKSDTE
ncbi:MAG: hypothetical protein K2Q34_01630 [Alphaproteobacteria bacterium]|nr:hypothetical protein [Alphaproteobacteria bacterium]